MFSGLQRCVSSIVENKNHGGILMHILSNISQYENSIHCVGPALWHSGHNKTMEMFKKMSGCQGLGK